MICEWGEYLVLFDLKINCIVDTGSVTYQAQSPDESALVLAAGDFGFVFKVTLSSTTGFLLSVVGICSISAYSNVHK